MRMLRAEIDKLENDIKTASDYYYNSPTGKGKVSDRIFDSWVEKLRELAPNSPVLKDIGAPIPVKKKVKLPVHMGSLDKIKPETADSWLNSTTGPFNVSDKLDGVSCLIVYDTIKGKQTRKAYTRGDGTYGQDITHLLPHMKVPDTVPFEFAEIRSEMIISLANFKKWVGKFENPRNMVAGITNRKDIHSGIKDIDVVTYELIEPRMKPSKAFSALKKAGFKTAWNENFQTLTAKSLSVILKQRKAESSYEIDGIVITKDTVNPVNTEGNPKYSKAFKELTADSIVKTKVVRVEWNVSKLGAVKPRVEIEPVRIAGVTVTWATGDNAKNIITNGIGPGAIVQVSRRGEVIPKIEAVLKAVEPQLPDIDEDYKWDATKTNFILVNSSKNETVIVKQLLSFFRIIGVENFSSGLVTRFYDHGLETINSIIKAKPEDFMEIEGIKSTMANKIYNNIQSKIKNVPLAVLMSASGCFPNLAEKSISLVLTTLPDILESYTDLNKNEAISMIASDVKGYSEISATVFVKGLYAFSKWLVKHNRITYVKPVISKKPTTELPLSGMQFVFTGFRDNEAEQRIKDLGGVIGSGVSSKTSILVVKDTSALTGKMQAAKKLGVKVLSKDEFLKWLSRY